MSTATHASKKAIKRLPPEITADERTMLAVAATLGWKFGGMNCSGRGSTIGFISGEEFHDTNGVLVPRSRLLVWVTNQVRGIKRRDPIRPEPIIPEGFQIEIEEDAIDL